MATYAFPGLVLGWKRCTFSFNCRMC